MVVTLQLAKDLSLRHRDQNVGAAVARHVTFRLDRYADWEKSRAQKINKDIATGVL
jgi:hypothetical protein